ncbi:possible CAAX amino terminal protease family protein [Pseudooceanicola batsensis HTCC2597]|uniref:Possible CAAX amino terminal protease family protein n=1 Tax=Pseudooceanicola batsensis (strain ATCC BAA-863 / DSM 15984 / KCTC 12145 / HTCC2597) TaxID=252305 RepID=A3TXD1_PSEBH|nr:CPBP family glutamic-type intramembrane protease [Pseudooceanicola batsensis]EAQ03491.1 possible CAAX amino terminal protease family protein [Pseudooceanicola batsensis HTCC2597]
MTEGTASDTGATDPDERFRFERADCDLPLYRGRPVHIGPAGWLLVLASVAVAFGALMKTQPMFPSGFGTFIPALLFVLIPLGTLAAVAGPRAPLSLFRPVRRRDGAIILGFFVLNAVATILLGLLVTHLFHTVANPAGDRVASAAGLDRILFFGWTAIQLLGEEIFTILPFLAFLAFLDRMMPRKAAIALAALGAAVIFALIHLPTYQWNLPQALIGLVPIRIILLMPYLITRNIWVSTGTHILNDWAIFGLSLLGGAPE